MKPIKHHKKRRSWSHSCELARVASRKFFYNTSTRRQLTTECMDGRAKINITTTELRRKKKFRKSSKKTTNTHIYWDRTNEKKRRSSKNEKKSRDRSQDSKIALILCARASINEEKSTNHTALATGTHRANTEREQWERAIARVYTRFRVLCFPFWTDSIK